MIIDQVRRVRENAPFKPFTLFLSDQRRFEIPHADYLWILPGGRSIGVAHEDGTAEFIDPVHITTLKMAGPNGAES
jgi:hypothetical protein